MNIEMSYIHDDKKLVCASGTMAARSSAPYAQPSAGLQLAAGHCTRKDTQRANLERERYSAVYYGTSCSRTEI